MGVADTVRRQGILKCINTNRRAAVRELAEQFKVSEATIRRDLLKLQQEGLLVKTYGGAVSSERAGFEFSFKEKLGRRAAEKEAIGRLAAELVDEGDTVMLDSGTTTLRLAAHLKHKKHITVVTNALCVVDELSGAPDIQLFILCGQLRRRTLDVAGPTVVSSIRGFNVDKAFLAVDGIDMGTGLTAADVFSAEVCRAMIRASRKVIVVADSSKFGRRAFAQIESITAVDMLVTDTGLRDEDRQRLEEMGIQVRLAPIEATAKAVA